jgi:hypothetical protein
LPMPNYNPIWGNRQAFWRFSWVKYFVKFLTRAPAIL